MHMLFDPKIPFWRTLLQVKNRHTHASAHPHTHTLTQMFMTSLHNEAQQGEEKKQLATIKAFKERTSLAA